MNKRPNLHAELHVLRGEIKKSESSHDSGIPRSVSPRAEPIDHPEIERMLRELQLRLAEVTEGVDDAISAHPLASVGAAFLLGIAVGRLTKRT